MATFSIVLRNPDRPNADGTFSVSIRIRHQRKISYINTPFRAKRNEIKKGEVSSPRIVSVLSQRIVFFQQETAKLGFAAERMDVKTLRDYLLRMEEQENNPEEGQGVDLFAFWRDEFLPSIAKMATKGLYATSLNRLRAFHGAASLPSSSINLRFLHDYEDWLRKDGVGERGINLYMVHFKKVFGTARDFLNDEDTGSIVIPNDPFRKYKIPSPPAPKREGGLSVEQVRRIVAWKPTLPDGRSFRAEQARDCFLLSLFLAGMNTADLYHSESLGKDWLLSYEREKTRTRRQDHAVQKIHVPEFLRHLVERYRDRMGERVFNFHVRYASHAELNRSVNKGLKQVGEDCGIPGLYYYQARHTFATIAHNELRYSLEDVGKCLTHVPTMKVTVGYVREDWSIVDEVNEAVADFVLGKEKGVL